MDFLGSALRNKLFKTQINKFSFKRKFDSNIHLRAKTTERIVSENETSYELHDITAKREYLDDSTTSMDSISYLNINDEHIKYLLKTSELIITKKCL